MITERKERDKARTGHFLVCWGVPKDIEAPSCAEDRDVTVIVFGPRRGRQTWRYVTNGMSELLQQSVQGVIRTELYACSEQPAKWAPLLLRTVAAYPQQRLTHLADFDTISAEGPIDRKSSPFTSILLAPVHPDDPQTVGELHNITDEPIFLHLVVPLHDSECDYAIKNGGEALWRSLLNARCSLSLDAVREPVV